MTVSSVSSLFTHRRKDVHSRFIETQQQTIYQHEHIYTDVFEDRKAHCRISSIDILAALESE
jgi:hypothetical protein